MGTNATAPLFSALSTAISSCKHLPQSTVAEQARAIEQESIGVLAQMCGILRKAEWLLQAGAGFTLFLVGLFWAEPVRRIKQRATNPGPPSPLRSLPLPLPRSVSGGRKSARLSALRSLKMPSRSQGPLGPGSKEFCREGSPIRAEQWIGAQGWQF